MFKKVIVEKEFHGQKISFETGRLARQAGGAVLVRNGDSIVLVTACGGEAKNGDFFPLTCDYVEKTYAAGKIPGGFFRREGKMSEKETLVSRFIDRPIRPLFPEGYTNEVQIMATVMSADDEHDTDILGLCGASAALTISDLPFEGPIAAVRVGRVDKKNIINPTQSQIKNSDLNFIVAATKDAIVMVEGGAHEVPEADVLDALFFAFREIQHLIAMQEELQQKAGKPKATVVINNTFAPFVDQIKPFALPLIEKGIRVPDKHGRRDALKAAKAEVIAKFVVAGSEDAADKTKNISAAFEDIVYYAVRDMVFKDKKRLDGRDTKTVRPIAIEVGLLPRTHGSALFTRGETQAIVVATLGTEAEAQRIDNLVGEPTKNFMLHYNFPAFSVGETRPNRGPGRREIGHGALAERAVKVMMPDIKEFPYVIRIVSEITESNGSSSMASVCGASLALMDAGVPIKAPVAGVAMGLIKDGKNYAILTDILGDEDHLGDMDFKVCGTEKGITALQMDIKIKGLEEGILREAMAQARDGRLHILKKMNEAITAPRESLSTYAPRIVTIKINPEKIRDIIGPGGKMIRHITDTYEVKMDVSDDGSVNIASADGKKINAAIEFIENLTREAEVNKIYKGKVVRITDFGAFVEIMPGTDGLLHISQISDERVNRVTDVLAEGDEVYVKVLEVDRQGKIRLSRKEAIHDMAQAIA